jgi:hypothetical protein
LGTYKVSSEDIQYVIEFAKKQEWNRFSYFETFINSSESELNGFIGQGCRDAEELSKILADAISGPLSSVAAYCIGRKLNKLSDFKKYKLKDLLMDLPADDEIESEILSKYRDEINEAAYESASEYAREALREGENESNNISGYNPILVQDEGNRVHNQRNAYDGLMHYISELKILDNIRFIEEAGNGLYPIEDIDLSGWLELADIYIGTRMVGSMGAMRAIHGHAKYISDVVSSNPALVNIFARTLSDPALNYNSVIRSANDFQARNPLTFGVLSALMKGEDISEEDFYERLPAAERNRIDTIAAQNAQGNRSSIPIQQDPEKEKIEKAIQERSKNLNQDGTIDGDDLKKMKELGLSNKPFPHRYQGDISSFPGASWFNDLVKTSVRPFKVQIYPPKDSVIPDNVLSDMNLHTNSNPPEGWAPSLGWVGGYIDFSKDIMYVVEIQSDIMQRTVDMKDPEKAKEGINQEVIALKKQREKLQSSSGSKLDSMKQRLLTMTPDHPGRAGLMQAIEQEKIKPQPVSLENQEKITQLDQRIAFLEQQSSISNPKERQFAKPQYHKYKSRLENLYKEWVDVFWNTIIRYAKTAEIQNLYVVTPDYLMKKWSNFAKPQTKILFEKIYSEKAKQYGGEPVAGGKWISIPLENAKFASRRNMNHNWYMGLKIASFIESQWKINLDVFLKIYVKKMLEEFPINDWEDANEKTLEHKQDAFDAWIETVPDNLKQNPSFMQNVISYCNAKHSFSPNALGSFNSEIEETNDTPSAEDLDAQWGN